MKKILKYFSILILVIGLCGMAYYPLAEWNDRYQRQKIIENLKTEVEKSDDQTLDQIKEQAQAWNRSLAGQGSRSPDLWPYEKQMQIHEGEDEMGWLKIPSIDLEMPVYHGTSKEVLAQGIGHLESSSLPVGGQDTHCVLSAHSGMENSKAFDDLRLLKTGDYFAFCSLGDWIGYRVESVETVLPEQTESLAIVSGQDRMTLVTCTPYGINDHRLLVHGFRSLLPDGFFAERQPLTTQLGSRRNFPILFFAAILVLVLGVCLYRKLWIFKRKKR